MKQAALLDVCYPDYFTGYHKPVLAVAVQDNMTHGELADAMEQEINATFDYLCDNEHGYTEEEMRLFYSYIEELREPDVINELFTEKVYESDEDDEFAESVYAYFAIINPTYSNGLMFLNP